MSSNKDIFTIQFHLPIREAVQCTFNTLIGRKKLCCRGDTYILKLKTQVLVNHSLILDV